MKRTALAFAAAAAVVGLAACTSQPASAADAKVAAASSAASHQTWADAKMHRWLSAEGARTIDTLIDPYNKIESWESPEDGTLVVHYGQNIWGDDVGKFIWNVLEDVDDAPDSLTLVTQNGTRYTYGQ